MTRHDHGNAWLTEDEIEFVKSLGTNTESTQVISIKKRIQLLLGYQKAAILRTEWGRLNRDTVLEFVVKEIQDLQLMTKYP